MRDSYCYRMRADFVRDRCKFMLAYGGISFNALGNSALV